MVVLGATMGKKEWTNAEQTDTDTRRETKRKREYKFVWLDITFRQSNRKNKTNESTHERCEKR